MFIKTFAALAALSMVGGAAHAGYYVNTEVESDFDGSDYTGSELETRVGYEGEINDRTDWFVEMGPTVFFEDGDGSTDTELGAEVGIEFAVTEQLDVYGEVEAFTGDNLQTSTKVGARWSF